MSIKPIEHVIFFYLHHFTWSEWNCKTTTRMIWLSPNVSVFITFANTVAHNHFLLAPFVPYFTVIFVFGKMTLFYFITRWMEWYSLDHYVPILLPPHESAALEKGWTLRVNERPKGLQQQLAVIVNKAFTSVCKHCSCSKARIFEIFIWCISK